MPRRVVSALQFGTFIGAGQFGTVYNGRHPIHGAVAIKVLQRLPAESDRDWNQRRDELLREGRNLKTAEHARVVRVFDISHDATDDKIYLVLELCAKGSLSGVYQRKPLGLKLVRDLTSDFAAGLECVHARGLLHRDIKPANILIGNDGRAKLGDFGLVTDRLVLGYGTMGGYSDHIAYEVWRDCRTSVKSDIWALGMTVYRLLHGHHFYSTLNRPRHEVPNGKYAQKLPWLPHIPKSWRSFIRKCMNDEPHLRYESVQQVLTALSQLPIKPDWFCSYATNRVFWCQRKNGRLKMVKHIVHSPRRHEWLATSKPLSRGRRRMLAQSRGAVSRVRANSELEAFFRQQ